MGDMAADMHESKEQQPAENAANDEATQKEAYNYWGYLLKPDKCGTDKLDNLLKGASGQAIQNMNIMFGLDEKEGLMLAPAIL